MDYYVCLEVDRSASPEVIKAAYRVLANKYHPDKNSSDEAAIKMKEINVAYEILSDVDLRFEYDKSLAKILSEVKNDFKDSEDNKVNTKTQEIVVPSTINKDRVYQNKTNRNRQTFFNLFFYIILALFIFDYLFNYTNQSISKKLSSQIGSQKK